MKIHLTESLVFSAPVASHDFQKRTGRKNKDVLTDPLRQEPNRIVAVVSLQKRVNSEQHSAK